jgi:hypothetical protein
MRRLAAQHAQLGDADVADLWNQCDALGDVADARIRLLNLPEPEVLSNWLAEVESLLTVDPDGRSLARAKLEGIIKSRLPPETRIDRSFQYAKVIGEIKPWVGKFEIGGVNPDGTVQWYYFLPADAQENEDEKTLGAKALSAGPIIAPFGEAADNFNDARPDVIGGPTEEASWKALRDVCALEQEKIETFCREFGADEEVDFEEELAFINEVLEHWQQVEAILSDR